MFCSVYSRTILGNRLNCLPASLGPEGEFFTRRGGGILP